MPDRRPYSVITNFGCHWKCPYCIVRNTGILVPETDFALTERTVMDLADGGGMGFLSFSGGGDPLWMLAAPNGIRRSRDDCTPLESKPKCTRACRP